MRNFDHVVTVKDRIGNHWFNTDPKRFAVFPDDETAAAENAAVEVEALVNRYMRSSAGEEKARIIADLVALHAHGKILWPMGALFNHSVLGQVKANKSFREALGPQRSDMLQLRDELIHDLKGPFGSYPEASRRDYGHAAWKCFLALRLATTRPMSLLRTYDHDAFEALASVVRPDGDWAEWFSAETAKGMRYAAGFLAQELGAPSLGASFVGAALRKTRRLDPFAACPHLRWLDELYEQWLDETNVLFKQAPRSGKRLLAEFLMTLPKENSSRVETAFNFEDMRGLLAFAKTWSTPGDRVSGLNKISEFMDFLERQHASKALRTSGPLLLGLERHEVEHFAKTVRLPARASNSGEVQARPMPTRYHHRLKEIIAENDFAWPKSLVHKRYGRPFHWIDWSDPATGRSSKVFCPVMPRLLLLLLDLPLRNIQARRLDSGEGDAERWNRITGAWEPNSGAHGGRWRRTGAGNPRRGVIRRIASGDGKSITGIYVNSNKTQDSALLFDETAGYEIPWEHMDVLQNLAAMRDWQERFNPVKGPLPHAELPSSIFGDEPSEKVRALIPDRFYLFRYPLNSGPRGYEAPPSYDAFDQFFHAALEELERRLNEETPERPVRIITGRSRSGAPTTAVYSMHGMRSSTLTGLHMAGVPIEVLSKVVAGHASILMTLSYIKFDPLHVSQVMTETRLKLATDAKDQFPDLLRDAGFEDTVRMTARLSDDGLNQMRGSYAEPSAWSRLDIGLCPNGGTQCHIGGEVVRPRIENGVDRSTYGPVPGGARNCVRCRFFVTGLPFLIPLWSHACAIMARADALAKQAADRDVYSRRLKQQRIDLRDRQEPVPLELHRQIDVTDELWDADCARRDQALADFHHTFTLIEKVRAIAQEAGASGDGGLPMLLPDDAIDDAIPELIFKQATRFEVIDAVVQQSRWFPSLQSADLEREREEFLNAILYRNGYVPIAMSPLSPSERQLAADTMAKFLLIELGAKETENLAAGGKSLGELGLQDGLEAACRRAVGRPLERIEMRPAIDAVAASSEWPAPVPMLAFANGVTRDGRAQETT